MAVFLDKKRDEGLSYREMILALKEKFNVSVTHTSIIRALQKKELINAGLLKGHEKLLKAIGSL
jgi:intein-encoded DNA endonuclease-like protein